MADFNFGKIEKKWQKRWADEKTFYVSEDSKKKKFYSLEMFPYPSGSGLHMGHALNYTIGDIIARYKIMQGYNVLHPIGFDALGLPAENAAIKEGTHPQDYTRNSIKNFVMQQKRLGLTYDWARVVDTSDPSYYKWDQWLFLKMLEAGLAYQKESLVNWCPECKTVLANEQVVDGKCWRHEKTSVESKYLKQWFFKLTNYADELLDNLDNMNWPETTKQMQKHWIGKSYGTEINFEVDGKKWPVFTTRPDTIYGVTFVVISPYHKELKRLVTAEHKTEVDNFLKKLKSVSEKDLIELEKEGAFTGSYAVNPINHEKVPIYIGNFVVADYGSGMVMAVPAHDKRDYEFAKKYDIPMKIVIDPVDFELDDRSLTEAYIGEGTLINSEKFNGMENEKAKEEVTNFLKEKGLGKKSVQFRLKDWGISRQRYWGTPIPIIHCEKCGVVPVNYEDLPIKLPKDVKFGEGNPLLTNEKWINVKCPRCMGKAKRETDTMDTFVNSSWYFLRYADPNNDKEIFDKKKVLYWCPTDVYIGGAEHACMHLIYSRYYVKFLRDIELVNFDEPALRLFHQGMLHGEDGDKMSKSKGNVVNPLDTIEKYGADSLRLFLVSVASPDKDFDWSEKGIQGSFRLIRKVYDFFMNTKTGKTPLEIEIKLNKSIKDIGEYIENFDYRKATIELRELFEEMSKGNELGKKVLEDFLKLLAPFCPHTAEELWEKLGGKGLVSTSSWPEFKEIELSKGTGINMNEKVIENVLPLMKRLEDRGEKISKVHLYVLPFEIGELDKKKLEKGLGKEVFIYSVKDPMKLDPEDRAKKAKPGMPGIWFE